MRGAHDQVCMCIDACMYTYKACMYVNRLMFSAQYLQSRLTIHDIFAFVLCFLVLYVNTCFARILKRFVTSSAFLYSEISDSNKQVLVHKGIITK